MKYPFYSIAEISFMLPASNATEFLKVFKNGLIKDIPCSINSVLSIPYCEDVNPSQAGSPIIGGCDVPLVQVHFTMTEILFTTPSGDIEFNFQEHHRQKRILGDFYNQVAKQLEFQPRKREHWHGSFFCHQKLMIIGSPF